MLTEKHKKMVKPIVFFDLETTGKPGNLANIRIIEISARKVDPDTLDEIDHYYRKCNNGNVPIDKSASDTHGMTEEDLIGLPTFEEKAKEVFDFFDGCDVGGYYCSLFDIPILYYSFLRAGLTWDYKNLKNYDIHTLYTKYNSGKLVDVYKRYTGKDLENAHAADADIEATIEVYKEMLKRKEVFEDEETSTFKNQLDMPGNFKIRVNESGAKEVYIDFGKWKGRNIDEVETSYFKWMFENGDFPQDTRYYAKKIYESKQK